MVRVTTVLLMSKRARRNYNFIDSLRIHVKGGTGGNGLPRYRGYGGKGGDVYVQANEKQTFRQLLSKNFTKRFAAGHGNNSRERCILGKSGNDLYIPVPVGVSVYAEHGLLGDLNQHENSVLVARGGPGGTHLNQYIGKKGQAHVIRLDLKLIADVGLIGFPNAGKSTLLRSISRASPKIAAYPFTTIAPQIAVLQYPDYRQITMADLPGLIEGAHYNVGMGHKFLKHVERTKLMLFVVDVNGFQLGPKYPFRSAFETVALLNKELELYKEELIDKPAILAVNKMDSEESETKLLLLLERLKKMNESLQTVPPEIRPERLVQFDEIFPIAANDGGTLARLRTRIRELLDFHSEDEDVEAQT